MATSNSANLAAIRKATAGIAVTLGRSKAFRKQLRKMLGVPKDGSVIKAVRALQEENARYQALGAAIRGLAA